MRDYEPINSPLAETKPKESGSYSAAFLCLIIYLVAWLVQAEIVKKIDYDNMFFFLYVRNSLSYPFLIPIGLFWQRHQRSNAHIFALRKKAYWIKRAKFSIVFLVLGFLTGYFWYLSIPRTSVTANSVIYQCNFCVVFILSVFLLGDKVTLPKVFAVLMCLIGGVLVALKSTDDDSSDNSTSLLGIILVVISMLIYSFYEVLAKRIDVTYGADESTADEATLAAINAPSPKHLSASDALIFLGLMGVFTLLLVWPFVIIAALTPWEPFVAPSWEVFGLMVTNSFLDVMLIAGLVVGILLSSPFFMAVGGLLAVPLSMLVDWMFNSTTVAWEVVLGSVLVIFGFLIMAYYERQHMTKKSHAELETVL